MKNTIRAAASIDAAALSKLLTQIKTRRNYAQAQYDRAAAELPNHGTYSPRGLTIAAQMEVLRAEAQSMDDIASALIAAGVYDDE